MTSQVMEELAERSVVGSVGPERLEAVDDHQRRTSLAEQFDQLGQHGGKTALVQAMAEVFVDDVRPDNGRVEETERLAVAEDLLERLGNRREVEGRTLGRGVVEEVLLGQDRLARSRTTHDEIDPVHQKAAIEHGVQTAPSRSPAGRSWSSNRSTEVKGRPEEVPKCRDELERIERLEQEGVGARLERLVARVDGRTATTGIDPCSWASRHSSGPAPPEMRRSMTTRLGASSMSIFPAVGASRAIRTA